MISCGSQSQNSEQKMPETKRLVIMVYEVPVWQNGYCDKYSQHNQGKHTRPHIEWCARANIFDNHRIADQKPECVHCTKQHYHVSQMLMTCDVEWPVAGQAQV